MAAKVWVNRWTCSCSSFVKRGELQGSPQPSIPSTKARLLSVSTSGDWQLGVMLNFNSRTSFYIFKGFGYDFFLFNLTKSEIPCNQEGTFPCPRTS